MTNKATDRQEYEVLHLSERDRAAFFEALIHPPEPTERLIRAFAEHERRVGPIEAELETTEPSRIAEGENATMTNR